MSMALFLEVETRLAKRGLGMERETRSATLV